MSSSDEERKWFSEAVMGTQLDVVQRMKEISTVLQLPEKALIDSGVTVKELEGENASFKPHFVTFEIILCDFRSFGRTSRACGVH